MSLSDSATELGLLRAYPTADGSFSLHSDQFGEAFHNSAGALNEAQAKFVRPAQLDRFQGGKPLAILDVCVGLGYNSAAVWEAMPPDAGALRWWGLELDRRPLDLALEQPGFQQLWSPTVFQRLQDLQAKGSWSAAPSRGQLLWGDARATLATIPEDQRFDLILQDAFSPQRCPELWSEQFLGALATRLAPGGRLLTYSRSAAVRGSLRRAGLQLFSLLPAPGERAGWSSGTMAVQPGSDSYPNDGPGWRALSLMEEEHLGTRAAVPFRDPSSSGNASEILQCRTLEQEGCGLEPTNAWQRRWAHTRQIKDTLET